MKKHVESGGNAVRGTFWRRLSQVAGVAVIGAAVSGASCGKSDNYQYIDVSIYADTNTVTKVDYASQIDTCEMYVTGSEMSNPVRLSCTPTQQNYPSLGTFEWSTTLGKGTLQFTVTLFALNRVPFATGTSDPVNIVPGQKLTANVVAVLVPGAVTGAGGASGTGGGTGTGGTSGSGGGPVAGAGGAGGTPGTQGVGGAGGTPGTGGAGGHGGAAGVGGSAGHGGAAGSGGSAGTSGLGGEGGSTTGAGGSAGGGGTAGAGGGGGAGGS